MEKQSALLALCVGIKIAETITHANDDPFLCRRMSSPGHNEFRLTISHVCDFSSVLYYQRRVTWTCIQGRAWIRHYSLKFHLDIFTHPSLRLNYILSYLRKTDFGFIQRAVLSLPAKKTKQKKAKKTSLLCDKQKLLEWRRDQWTTLQLHYNRAIFARPQFKWAMILFPVVCYFFTRTVHDNNSVILISVSALHWCFLYKHRISVIRDWTCCFLRPPLLK